jgi:hypothetical protein
MLPADFLSLVIAPGLALMPDQMDSPEARALLLAIAGQESNWSMRAQIGGPAHGFFQCERNGVLAVLQNDATRHHAEAVASMLSIAPCTADALYAAVQWNDPMACCIARLLLWADPHPLPALGDQEGAWETYLRCWRPGKPDPSRWPSCHVAAFRAVRPAAEGLMLPP